MKMNDYAKLAQRTSTTSLPSDAINNGILGLCGEAGELAELWKKYMYQGHEFDRELAKRELGDVLWYVVEAAKGLGATLEEIALLNMHKLRARYPDGFDCDRSINREGDDL